MTKEEKIAVMNYLYINNETKQFLCNDLFQEFLSIIPENICISEENKDDKKREQNYSCVKMLIYLFFENNLEYKKITTKLLSNFTYEKMVEHLIIGYVFYLANIDNKNIDIFKDKKSICFSEAPPLYQIIL